MHFLFIFPFFSSSGELYTSNTVNLNVHSEQLNLLLKKALIGNVTDI